MKSHPIFILNYNDLWKTGLDESFDFAILKTVNLTAFLRFGERQQFLFL